MSHDELNGMADGYALSALDPDDLKAFEAHLATCPECQASVAELRPLVDALALTNEAAEPADGLREQILASARAESRRSEPTSRAIPTKLAPWWRRPVLWPLPVAAVITALAVAIAVVAVWGSQADDSVASAQPQLEAPWDDFAITDPADARLAEVQRRLSLSYEGIEIMARAEQWWRFDGSGVNPAAAGTLAYSEEFGAACLLVLGLAEGDQSVYQARLTDAGGQVSVHQMWRFNNSLWLVLEGNPNKLQKLEIILFTTGSLPPSEIPAVITIPLKST